MNNPDYLYWAEHYAAIDPNEIRIQQYRVPAEHLVWWCIFLQVEHDSERHVRTLPRSITSLSGRRRQCVIRVEDLQGILDLCNRHISNIGKTQMDYIEEGDGTPTDDFYCKMFRESWADLRDDVEQMIKNKNLNL